MQKLMFILGELRDDDIDWIIQNSNRLEVQNGDVLIEEGGTLNNLYILLDGSVSVIIQDKTIATLYPGEIFGEMSFLDSRAPSATVIAQEKCVVLGIPRTELSDRLQRDIYFSAGFYRAIAMFLSDRLRSADSRMSSGKTHSYEQTLDEITNPELLNNYHLARNRYDWFLSRLRESQDFMVDLPTNF